MSELALPPPAPQDAVPDPLAAARDGADAARVLALLAELDAAAPATSPLMPSAAGSTDAASALATAREAVHAALADTEARRASLLVAEQRLDQLEVAFDYRRRFDADGWLARRAALATQLAADPRAGTRAWVAAWAGALTAGRFDEAARLLNDELGLAPELLWVAARCGDVTAAAEAALTGSDEAEVLVGGLRRCELLLRWLEERAPLAGQPSITEAQALDVALLHAQWVLAAGEDGSMVVRLANGLGLPVAERSTLAALQASDPRERLTLARRALEAGAGPAAAAIVVAALEDTAPEDAEREADRWVAAVAMLDGIQGRLDVLPVPVPSMLWLALAGRAVDEGHADAESLLAVGEGAATTHRAYLGHVRLRLVQRREASATPDDLSSVDTRKELADLYESAATDLVIAGESGAAREAYEAALALVPDHPGATLGRIDAIMVATSDQPIDEVRAEVEQALADLTEAHARIDIDATYAWSLLDEALLRRRLVSALDPTRNIERWRALVAVDRALAHQADTGAWRVLATACSDLGAYYAAVAAADTAIELSDPATATAAVDAYLGSAVSVGMAQEVLARLDALEPGAEMAWHRSVRAYALLLTEPATARDLAKSALDEQPDSLEIRWILASAHALAGDDRDAERQWRALWREAARGEESATFQVAAAAMELGYLADADDRFQQLFASGAGMPDDGVVTSYLGATHLLQGHPEGVDELITAVRSSPTPRYVEDIRVLLVDRLGELANRLHVEQPELDPVRGAIKERLAELEPPPTPDAELLRSADEVLASLAPGDADLGSVVRLASRTTAAVFRREQGDVVGAGALLAEATAVAPDLAELALLASSLEATAPPPVDDGDTDVDTEDADLDLDLDADGDATSEGDDEYVYQVVLGLPARWFEGMDNPVRDHPVLNRYLPDARDRLARLGVELPPVRVSTLEDDDPATYQILIGGDWIAEGTVAEDRWFVPTMFLPSLPAPLAEAAAPVPDAPELVTVPITADADPATLLVACPAAEVIVRTLESIVAAGALAEPDPDDGDETLEPEPPDPPET